MKKNSNVYLDSSFLIAYIIKEHRFNSDAVNILKKYISGKFYISYLTIDEALYYMKDHFSDKIEIRDKFKDIVSALEIEFIGVESNSYLVNKYIDHWIDTGLKPRDAMHLFIMKENNIKDLASFDNDFIKSKKKYNIEIIK
jgi:predicted nucleic acid-binding protein